MSEKFVANSVILYDEKRSDYKQGEEVRIKIPATSVAVLSPRNTFLRFRINITNSDITDGMLPAILNSELGGASLIRTLSIYSNDGTLLEQIDNYNLLAYLQSYYSTNDTERSMKGLIEGATSTKNKTQNPFYSVKDEVLVSGAYGPLTRKEVEICLPLRLSGLLNPLNHNGSIPVIALGGLEIRILLEQDVEKVLQLTTGAGGDGRCDDTFGYDPSNVCARFTTKSGITTGDPYIEMDAGDNSTTTHGWDDTPYLPATQSMAMLTGKQFFNETTPFLIGQRLTLTNLSDPLNQTHTTVGRITNIENTLTHTNIRLSQSITVPAGMTFPNGSAITPYQPVQTWGYTLSDVAMVCGTLKTDPNYISALANKSQSSAGISFDIMSFNNYMVNHNSGVLKQSLYIPMNESRAYSIISIPEDIGKRSVIMKDELRPAVGEPKNYHYIIKNIRVPNRNVELSRVRETDLGQGVVCRNEPIHTKELGDAIKNNGWKVSKLDRVDKCYAIGRGLSRYGHTFNARDSVGEVRLNLEYSSQPNSLLWNNFVSHLRNIRVSSAGVVVSQ